MSVSGWTVVGVVRELPIQAQDALFVTRFALHSLLSSAHSPPRWWRVLDGQYGDLLSSTAAHGALLFARDVPFAAQARPKQAYPTWEHPATIALFYTSGPRELASRSRR